LRFKIDENLPAEFAAILAGASHDAQTVAAEMLSGADDELLFNHCEAEERILIALDLDFANLQAYPPGSHPGIVVFRPGSQDKKTLLNLLKRLLPLFDSNSPHKQLWIVEMDRVRYRQ
jgi:predicted nuclease of predicted toxin-antitoxin system